MQKYDQKDASSVWHCWNQMEVYLNQMFTLITEAKGKKMIDQDGKEYLDANSSLWNVNIGHGEERVIQAINDQLKQLEYAPLFLATNAPSIKLAKKLIEITENRYQHVFYTNSGSEATDTSFKIARHYYYNQGKKDKNKIISLERAYHGSTFGALSACGIEYEKGPYGPLLNGFFQVKVPDPYFCPKSLSLEEWIQYCVDELEELILREGPETIAAYIAEPIQGTEGVCVIPDLYWEKVSVLMKKYDILWIVDEVATGFGRTGEWFAVQHTDSYPDIMLMAKGITSGYIPLGAVMVSEKIYNEFLGPIDANKELVHGFTTSGHPVACAAALENIKFIEDNHLVQNTKQIGQYLLESLKELKRFKSVSDVQGKGLKLGIRLTEGEFQFATNWPPSMLVTKLLMKEGVIVHAAGTHAVVMSPTLTFNKEDCDKVVNAFSEVLKMFDKLMVNKGNSQHEK